jgi:hypothetical protein
MFARIAQVLAGVPQHVGMNKKREFRSHARPGHQADRRDVPI